MLSIMRKIPGGMLLLPMLISAIVNTFFSQQLHDVGTITEAFFTTRGTNYIIGAVTFCSACTLDLKRIKTVLRKQGVLILVKIIVCFVLGYLYIRFFGLAGIGGISAVAFIAAICSVNPALYLALTGDFETEEDTSAFGLLGLLCVPAFPLLVYSVSRSAGVDWNSIISVLIPMLLGAIIANVDKPLAKFFSSGMGVLTPLMGWSFGAGINIINALASVGQGILLTVIFYVVTIPILYFVETHFIKSDGVSAISMSSVAGLTASVPTLIAASDAATQPLAETATAQIAFAVMITSIVTPMIVKWMDNHDMVHPDHD